MKDCRSEKSICTSLGMMLLCMAVLVTGCATKRVDLVKTQTAEVYTIATDTHLFEHVQAFQQGHELVLYGKIRKAEGFCISPGWVDVAILSGDKVLYKAGLPHLKASKRARGWYGAHFRIRVPLRVPSGAQIRIAYHGDDCHPGETFDVANNRAIPQHTSKQ